VVSFVRDILSLVQRALEPLPVRGKGRLAEQILRRTKAEMLSCHPLSGMKVQLRRSQRIERLMWAGDYEREVLALMKRVLKSSMNVMDIGANIGYIAAIAAALVGAGGEVHAFEPNPSCYPYLVQNLNPFSHAYAHQMAISDTQGMLPLYLGGNSAEDGWGSLLPEPRDEGRVVQVEVTSIDAFVSRSIGRRVDLIKIDIEGNELHALRGALQTIERNHPVIIAELNAWCLARDSVTPAEVVQFLKDQGYLVRRLDSENVWALFVPTDLA
jgi:FkbM family methyltransferase